MSDEAARSFATMTPPPAPRGERLVSLDALRGFDMFWINGGEGIFHALAAYTGWSWLVYFSKEQLDHVPWDGFHFYDLIFPMFLFLAGVALPLMLTRRLERGETKGMLYGRVFRRWVLLIVLGWIYNGILNFKWRGGGYFDFHTFRFATVLGLIATSYLFASIVVLNTTARGQVIWAAGILLGYWAASRWVAVPPLGGGPAEAHVITAPGFFTGYIDRHLMPGRLYLKTHDPEGLFLPIAGAAMALLGALTGHWLLRRDKTGMQKFAGLLLRGVALLALGMFVANPSHPIAQFWHAENEVVANPYGFPIIKNCWSSSFVMYAAGWATLLLAFFYLIVDVLGWRAWALPFVVIGMNAILLYVGAEIIHFDSIAKALFGGITGYFDTVSDGLGDVLMAFAIVLVEVLFLYFLYRKKVFLRV